MTVATDWRRCIGSASLKDTQSGWSNVALRLSGAVLPTLLASELSMARFSGWRGRADAFTAPPAASGAAAASACTPGGPAAQAAPGFAAVQVLTEGATRDELLAHLGRDRAGDSIDVAMYRLADRAVVEGVAGGGAARCERAADARSERRPPRTAACPVCPTSRWRASWCRAAPGRSTCAGTERTASTSTARSSWSTTRAVYG